jgi:hypothetical protein
MDESDECGSFRPGAVIGNGETPGVSPLFRDLNHESVQEQ